MRLGTYMESRRTAHQPVILKCLSNRIKHVCFIFRLLVDSPKLEFIDEGVTDRLDDRQVVDSGGEKELGEETWDVEEDR